MVWNRISQKWGPISIKCQELKSKYCVQSNFTLFYKFSADFVWFGMVWTQKSQKSGPKSIKCQEIKLCTTYISSLAHSPPCLWHFIDIGPDL